MMLHRNTNGNSNKNQITNLQETIIRRINRQMKIERKGNKLTAFIPLPVDRWTDGNAEYNAFDGVLTLENDGKVFTATITRKTVWKRFYWRKWRQTESVFRYENESFHELSKTLKRTLSE